MNEQRSIDAIASESSLLVVDETHHTREQQLEGVVLLPLQKGIEAYPAYREMLWSLVDPQGSETARRVIASERMNGMLIVARKGTRNILPLKTCYMINTRDLEQKVHNLILIEEGAELHIVTGCTSSGFIQNASHRGVTEMFVGEGATLSYTMVHEWNRDTEVYPVTTIRQERDSTFVSNYISFEKVKKIESNPISYMGTNARARFNSVIFAPEGAYYNVGSRAVLEGDQARVEIISRNVSAGGTIVMPAHINNKARGTKGHIECSALMLEDGKPLHAIPQLESTVQDAELTHEAAIGKISEDELNYLMSRGLTEEEATQAIVRGFLTIESSNLPPELQSQIDRTLAHLSTSSL